MTLKKKKIIPKDLEPVHLCGIVFGTFFAKNKKFFKQCGTFIYNNLSLKVDHNPNMVQK